MARRTLPKKKEQPKYHCRDCAHSYDWHEKSWEGKPFLCRCPFYKNGKFSKFLKDPQCALFEKREDNGKGQMA